MGDPGGEGLQTRADIVPISVVLTRTPENQGLPLNRRGSTETHNQGCREGGPSLYGPIPQSDFPGPQEGRISEVGDQPEAPESVHPPGSFQDGESRDDERPAKGGRLDGLDRPQRCLPVGHNMGRSSEVPEVPMERHYIRVPVPPFRPEQCTTCLHQVTETCTCKAPSAGNKIDNVPGRHAGDGTVQGGAGRTLISDHFSVRRFRLCGQQGEVSADTNPDNTIPRLQGGFQGDESQTLGGEGNSNYVILHESQREGIHISERSGQINRQDDSNPPCHLSSPSVVQRTSTPEEPGTPEDPVIRDPCEIEPGGCSGTRLVVNQEELDRGEEHFSTGTRPHHGDRRFNAGLGSSLPRRTHRGTLVPNGRQESYQLLRTSCSYVRSESIYQRQEEHSDSLEDGQQNGSVLCESDGGDSFTSTEQAGNPTLALVPGEESVHHSRIPPRSRQLCGGRGIQGSSIHIRVATTPSNIPTDIGYSGQLQHRPFRNSPQRPAQAICELETRPRCSGDRCPPVSLEQLGRVRLPTLLPNRQVHQENQGGRGHSDNGGTCLALTAMVPGTPRTFSGFSPDSTRNPDAIDRPIQQPTSSDNHRTTATSRLEIIRNQQQAEGISSGASQLLAAGWSRGTNTTYESAWKRWDSWCSERKIDPISCAIQPFLEFLTSLFKEGLQYRTINTIRSAISMTHKHIEGTPLGQHPLVSRLLRGVYNTRPPQPRYSATWDVDIVIKYFQSLGENDTLPLKTLTQKLTLLMALVGANRVSELQALDLRYRSYSPEGVCFQLPTLSKKRRAGAPPRQLIFGAFPSDSRLCVIRCLQQYEATTRVYREENPGSPQLLFLSYVKPHKPVTSQRLAHWLKELLGKAGIDTSVFKAHSVRGASSTAASMKGVLIEDILRTADWSTDSTFRRFYYRPTLANNYAQTVLQPRADSSQRP